MRANQKWAMDFMTDSLTTGKKLRVFNVVDVFSRECPVIEIGTSMPSSKVIEILENLALERGLPETLKNIPQKPFVNGQMGKE
jgi:putative transposase